MQRVATTVVSEVQAPEVEAMKPREEVKASQQTNASTTERAQSIIEYLNPTVGSRKPLSDGLSDSPEVEEDKLEEDKVEEQDFLQSKDTNMCHHHKDRKYPASDRKE